MVLAGKTMPFFPPMTGNGLHHLFMVIWGMVDYCCIHIKVFFDYGGLMDRLDSKPCFKKKNGSYAWGVKLKVKNILN